MKTPRHRASAMHLLPHWRLPQPTNIERVRTTGQLRLREHSSRAQTQRTPACTHPFVADPAERGRSMRTRVKITGPAEKKASRARASVYAAPCRIDVVDAHTDMRMVHLRAKGRRPRGVRRWLSTVLREAEAHLRSGRPLCMTRSEANAKRNRHGGCANQRDTRVIRGGRKRPPATSFCLLA